MTGDEAGTESGGADATAGETSGTGTDTGTDTGPGTGPGTGNGTGKTTAPGDTTGAGDTTGTTGLMCDPGLTDCSGECVDLQTSKQNCGECGNVCAGPMDCVMGMCMPK